MADRADLMLLQYMNSVPEHRRLEFQMAYQGQKKDRTTALLLSLFLGYLGVDRFYLGQSALGVAKLLTAGGCGVWALVDWFMIMGATDRKNMDALNQIGNMYRAMAPPIQTHAIGGYGPPSGGGYGPPPSGYGPPPGA
ncbi:MAG: TM2 domain-containing protein [Polyangiaceae bacterium]